MNTGMRSGVIALLGIAALAGQAQAGGLERGGYNIDLLFDPSSVTSEATGVYVAPERKLKNVKDSDTSSAVYPYNGTSSGAGGGDLSGRSTSVTDTKAYENYRAGIKVGFTNGFDCLVDYSQPWGAHTKPGSNWAGANENVETKVSSENYALTCSYKFDVGPGQLRVIGGGFYQKVWGFKERLVQDFTGYTAALSGIGRLDLEGDGWGWRTGVAYEIPEYAMRASLVYNSEVKLSDITGTLDLTQVGRSTYEVYGSQNMPDSVELKLQSGIAPDWLAFGSVKWTDWSQFQKIPFYYKGTQTQATSLDLGYRDGWTITTGIGHKFTDQWSGAVSVTWDQGTSQGYGTQTDTWALGLGVSYNPNKNVELQLAGLVGILTSGKSGSVVLDGVSYGTDASYEFGNDFVGALSAKLKVKF
ncbi:OmpP1/FadL family transporter [Rhizobium paknamense]|uniref:Long-chain fatty acid transport protein n=1 Tax=Rhizobium paknamense TaxID=1206817 RepID=A0ABU0IHQ2_9HYPH|nr:OmpP1/FadL family transporter [Rhizobium paknamense]MDQ0457192.1 long-chain fatty acid transport protein [Rhizobium paknamense]